MSDAGAWTLGRQDKVALTLEVTAEALRASQAQAEADAPLRRALADLAEDLGVVFAPELRLRGPLVDEPGAARALSVTLDGARLDVPYACIPRPAARPGELAEAVLETLLANRAELATDALVEALCRSHPGDGADAVPVRAALRDALQRGFDLPTALELCEVAVSGGEDSVLETELLAAARFARSVEVEVGRAQYDALMVADPNTGPGRPHRVDALAESMRDGLFFELGIRPPPVRIVFGEELDDRAFRVRLNRLRGPIRRGLGADEVLVNDRPERLALLDVPGRPTTHPVSAAAAARVPAEYAPICQQAGLTTWDAAGYIVLSLSGVLKREVANWFTMAQAEYHLRQLDQAFPMLVFNVLERYPMVTLTRVLRELLAEQISIRNLRDILEALLAINGTVDAEPGRPALFSAGEVHPVASPRPLGALTDAELTGFVRSRMRRYISHKYSGGSALRVLTLGPDVERRLQSPAALSATERERLIDAVATLLERHSLVSGRPPILASPQARARLRQELATVFPRLPVLSRRELTADVRLERIGCIDWSTGPAP